MSFKSIAKTSLTIMATMWGLNMAADAIGGKPRSFIRGETSILDQIKGFFS